MRKLSILVLFIFCAALIGGCAKKDNAATGIKVLATVYPVYEFARQVGGDKVTVEMLLPPGAEPHDWEPTAKDLAKLKAAKLFVYHGAGLEPTDKLLSKDVLGNTQAVEVSRGIARLKDEHGAEAHEHGHGNGDDPHIWLDPLKAEQEVKNIAEALAGVDPENAAYYHQRAEAYSAELKRLDQEYEDSLAKLQRRELVTTHSAFAYLAQRYRLTQVGMMGLSPEAEPTTDKLREVAAFCRAHQVKTIFFESQAK